MCHNVATETFLGIKLGVASLHFARVDVNLAGKGGLIEGDVTDEKFMTSKGEFGGEHLPAG